jgi:hypothetical protein
MIPMVESCDTPHIEREEQQGKQIRPTGKHLECLLDLKTNPPSLPKLADKEVLSADYADFR